VSWRKNDIIHSLFSVRFNWRTWGTIYTKTDLTSIFTNIITGVPHSCFLFEENLSWKKI
jgi:hypothetical protein